MNPDIMELLYQSHTLTHKPVFVRQTLSALEGRKREEEQKRRNEVLTGTKTRSEGDEGAKERWTQIEKMR